MKVKIKSWLDGAKSWRLAVEAAVKSGANLYGANLYGADLSGADLSRGIDLFPISILGHRHFIQTTHDGKLQIGCHIKSFDEWEAEAEKSGKDNNYKPLDVEIYKLHIAHVARVARLLWADKFPTSKPERKKVKAKKVAASA